MMFMMIAALVVVAAHVFVALGPLWGGAFALIDLIEVQRITDQMRSVDSKADWNNLRKSFNAGAILLLLTELAIGVAAMTAVAPAFFLIILALEALVLLLDSERA